MRKVLENLPDLIVERKSRRSYPHSNIASQIIGFTNTDDSGLVGIERQFEKYLSGKDGWIVKQVNVAGKTGSFHKANYQNKIQMMGQIFNLLLILNIRAFFRKNCKEE